MSKKYEIVNSDENDSCVDFYIFYIFLFFIIIFVFFFSSFNFNIEGFNDLKCDTDDLIKKKEELEKERRKLIMASKYLKVDDSSIDNIMNFVNDDFNNNHLPSFDKNKFRIIKKQADLNKFTNDVINLKYI